MLIAPKYEFDDRLKIKREVNKPPHTLYVELGYNEEPPKTEEEEKKHYRRYYEDELENNKEIFPKSPFHTSEIIRGQSRGLKKSFFSFLSKDKTDDSGQVTNLKTVGLFKGRVNVENKEEKEEFKVQKEQRMKIIMALLEDLH